MEGDTFSALRVIWTWTTASCKGNNLGTRKIYLELEMTLSVNLLRIKKKKVVQNSVNCHLTFCSSPGRFQHPHRH